MTLFVKRYADPARTARALANYRWLAGLNSGVQLPDLVDSHETVLTFAKLDGRSPDADDLGTLAATIGKLQRAAAPGLTAAQLDRRHATGIHVVESFTETRRASLHQAAATYGYRPQWIDDVLDRTAGMPAAFYKDSNLRNFVVTSRGIAVVDFDDLTLAPHGYDLAKLIVSFAMTLGHVEAHQAFAAYNAAVGHNACTINDLKIWAELNWLLTANYLGRNGYENPWPNVRPWASPSRKASDGDHH